MRIARLERSCIVTVCAEAQRADLGFPVCGCMLLEQLQFFWFSAPAGRSDIGVFWVCFAPFCSWKQGLEAVWLLRFNRLVRIARLERSCIVPVCGGPGPGGFSERTPCVSGVRLHAAAPVAVFWGLTG